MGIVRFWGFQTPRNREKARNLLTRNSLLTSRNSFLHGKNKKKERDKGI